MMKDIRIAAVVCRCPVGQVKQNLEQIRCWALLARDKGATLVCFPELNLTGYSNHRKIAGHAISVHGPEIELMVRLAAELSVALLIGFAEKNAAGTVYASHMVITPEGRTGVYRKLHLAPPETDQFRPGSALPVFHWSGIRFGIQLCYDAHFPELSTRMAETDADIIFMPHASPRGQAADKHQSWMRHLPARAFDNGLFVVACNQTGDNGNGLVFPGNAVVFSPSGEIMETRLTGEPGMIVVDLTAERIQHVRSHRMRYFFPNRRPGLYDRMPVLSNLDE
ncbi:amidohydrolase [Desulfosarcina alkanivorans]|jgi:N-carbamoylputrescine amidase|uniref:Amidohydrolase n=1 Tax=Desulfosarcina alkanivorans TaxID=571177 RepID=A0A5K7YZ13_9BACT|nr:nitrilase-related carbon-nitrogen hydrolase [Desulfosarcina alkanivorans]BBO71514.1 amidohydrolase [Desulfosarcina alkanivorans]